MASSENETPITQAGSDQLKEKLTELRNRMLNHFGDDIQNEQFFITMENTLSSLDNQIADKTAMKTKISESLQTLQKQHSDFLDNKAGSVSLGIVNEINLEREEMKQILKLVEPDADPFVLQAGSDQLKKNLTEIQENLRKSYGDDITDLDFFKAIDQVIEDLNQPVADEKVMEEKISESISALSQSFADLLNEEAEDADEEEMSNIEAERESMERKLNQAQTNALQAMENERREQLIMGISDESMSPTEETMKAVEEKHTAPSNWDEEPDPDPVEELEATIPSELQQEEASVREEAEPPQDEAPDESASEEANLQQDEAQDVDLTASSSSLELELSEQEIDLGSDIENITVPANDERDQAAHASTEAAPHTQPDLGEEPEQDASRAVVDEEPYSVAESELSSALEIKCSRSPTASPKKESEVMSQKLFSSLANGNVFAEQQVKELTGAEFKNGQSIVDGVKITALQDNKFTLSSTKSEQALDTSIELAMRSALLEEGNSAGLMEMSREQLVEEFLDAGLEFNVKGKPEDTQKIRERLQNEWNVEKINVSQPTTSDLPQQPKQEKSNTEEAPHKPSGHAPSR